MVDDDYWADDLLSALDPGKQGLKHVHISPFPAARPLFQRLIQENKD